MSNDFKLENLTSYKISCDLASIIYKVIKDWSYLDKQTIGIQLIRAIDSIAANIAEGFGRYHKKDKIKFYYNARASAFESNHWIKTAFERNLLKEKDYAQVKELLEKLPKEINLLIKLTANNLKV